MFTSIRNFFNSLYEGFQNTISAFRRWWNQQITRIMFKLAVTHARSEIAKTTRKVCLVAIPPVNFALTLISMHFLYDASITMDYILFGTISPQFLPMFWASFWQSMGIVIVIFLVILMLNWLWRKLATIVITRNVLYTE